MFSTGELKHKLKVVLLGESSVGKTCLMQRFTDGHFGSDGATTGASFRYKTLTINDELVRLMIWDTAGSERFHALTPMYYRNANVVFVVYDIGCRSSFVRAKSWITELRNSVLEPVVVALVGNKLDLSDARAVDYQEAMKYAVHEDLLFTEASAKTSQNVEKIFRSAVESAVLKGLMEKEESVQVPRKDVQQQRGCCYS